MSYVREDRPWLEGFNAFYEAEIAPLVFDLAEARATAAKAVWQRSIIVSAVAVPVVSLVFVFVDPEAAIFAIFAAIAGWQFWARKPAREFSDTYKQEIVGRMAPQLGLTYRAEPIGFNHERYRTLKLIPRHDRSTLEDSLTGLHETVEISYLEAHLQQKRRTKNGTHYVTVFKGPLLSLTFPKPFIGTTLVQTDRTAIGNFLSGKFTKGERVRLEDPEFEDQFEVYSTSQTEARFILTPDFMERMLILQRQMGKKLQAAFHDNDMLIAVNGAEDNCEAGSLDEQADPHAPILNTVEELRAIFDLIETLNLTSQTRAS